jgi:hypothetical protein
MRTRPGPENPLRFYRGLATAFVLSVPCWWAIFYVLNKLEVF